MPIFRIIFTGLNAIVPRGGELTDPANFPTSLTVLLPNLLKPCILNPYGEFKIILPSHFPLLDFNLDNLAFTNDQLRFLSYRKPEEGSRGAALLDFRDVSFLRDGKKLPPGVTPVLNPPTGCDDPEEEDVTWLVEIEDISQVDCWIKPRFLHSLHPLERDVVTRLELSGGTLRTFELHEEESVFPSLGRLIQVLEDQKRERKDCAPDPDEGLYCEEPVLRHLPRAWEKIGDRVASRVAFEFEFEKEVSVVVRGFGGKKRRRLVFAPPPERPYDDVEIVISNLEADELLGVPVEERYGGGFDPDFSVYYRLVEFRHGLDPAFLQGRIPRVFVLSGGGYGKPCSPTRILESENVVFGRLARGPRPGRRTRRLAARG